MRTLFDSPATVDADHLGTEVCEDHPRERARADSTDLQDAQPFKWPAHRVTCPARRKAEGHSMPLPTWSCRTGPHSTETTETPLRSWPGEAGLVSNSVLISRGPMSLASR